ncbi:flagellar basal body rod protein FlgC [Candidatus Igneacidithiobacillus taiwanensis]|uniref:flagellar basal body rod protein FlgC n=1 Tax=Candidatus Igneacidithiobacillus taiwanensis TaxID=1945924 RepID=UPI00289FFCC9|nr:flagellar basal body rod protein FlgC [Candidatus Igneacidithiobacillus taiwanensis]MCE5359562.1 flagellar basal body rod protein FlgC [Acidithiobacillus sp.]
MSLFSVFNVASSGLTAQSYRLNVVASNLANANSATSSTGQPYRAREVVFAAQPMGSGPAGVDGVAVAGVVEKPGPFKLVYEPGNPLADAQGYVKMPNVNPVDELVNMISASRAYQANVNVLETTKSLMQKTLTLGA